MFDFFHRHMEPSLYRRFTIAMHVLVRNYFSRVPGMMEKMEEKVSEMPLPRPKERVLLVPWRNDVNKTDRSLSGSKNVTPV